ncbi:MAG: hypothetical protein K0R54_4319 [Clostridiaceae bacterium]|jgi:hypothetical protein|nr:hypothetical protein [Clostridiaceae bacterium]
MTIKKIFSKKIAMELVVKGNELLHTEQNFKYKNLSVFVFEETTKLLTDLTEITAKNYKNK